MRIGGKHFAPRTSNHSLYLTELNSGASYSGENFGVNQLPAKYQQECSVKTLLLPMPCSCTDPPSQRGVDSILNRQVSVDCHLVSELPPENIIRRFAADQSWLRQFQQFDSLATLNATSLIKDQLSTTSVVICVFVCLPPFSYSYCFSVSIRFCFFSSFQPSRARATPPVGC